MLVEWAWAHEPLRRARFFGRAYFALLKKTFCICKFSVK